MALGLDQAIAEYLSAQGYGGLYDDSDPASRVIFIEGRPPASRLEVETSDVETSADAMIMVALAGGSPPNGLYDWSFSVKIECRHPNYEDALGLAHGIFRLLHENGGFGNGCNANAVGDFSGIKVIRMTADYPPFTLGRDRSEEGGRSIMTQTFTVRTKPFTLS